MEISYLLQLNSTWTSVTIPLSPEAYAADTQIRWRGPENCVACQFALDDGKITISICADNYIVVM